MSRGLFRKGWIAVLYKYLQGFIELQPKPRKRRRPRQSAKKQRFKPQPGSTPRTRIRMTPLNLKFKPGGLWQLIGGKYQQATNPTVTASGPYEKLERTQDFKNSGPPYRTGGTFFSVKVDWLPNQVVGIGRYTTMFPINLNGITSVVQYRGGFHTPDFSSVDFPDSQYANQNFVIGPSSGFVPSMSPYHTLVDKRLRPKINSADIGQSLAEMREVPGMLRSAAKDFHISWKSLGGDTKRLSPKAVADSYLGIQFGWTPFVKDVYDVCNLVINYDQILSQKVSKNGKWDHRESVLFEQSVPSIISSGEGMRCQPNAFWLDQMLTTAGGWTKRFQYSKHEVIKVWASGDYMFYRPEFDMSKTDYDSGLNQIKRISTLLGTNISPSLLWKITPWSWLVDWVSNVGDIISSVSAAGLDGVVSKNVFLMMSFRRDLVLTQELNFADRPISFEFRRSVVSKQRTHALTPYQFSLLPTQLSAKQWSILGALGISKFL